MNELMIVGDNRPAFSQYEVIPGRVSTCLPDMDFETYSEAGYYFDESTQKWKGIKKSKSGIEVVGAAVYSEHPSTRVLSLAYDLKDGLGPRVWLPGMEEPDDLFDHVRNGGIIEAHNSMFEFLIWTNVCFKRMGWPEISLSQMRCSAAKCAAFSIPRALGKAGDALGVAIQKLEDGKRLIKKFSCPRNPTKNNPSRSLAMRDDTIDAAKFIQYNIVDIVSESAISAVVPDLLPFELETWLHDQHINYRGVHVDMEGVVNCIKIVEQATIKYNEELPGLTDGAVTASTERQKILDWLASKGFPMSGFTADDVEAALEREDLTPPVRRVLEIRSLLAGTAVQKLFAMNHRACIDNRVRDVILYCGADRTGRFAGRGIQPQNFPNSGPEVCYCESCGTTLRPEYTGRPCSCGAGTLKKFEWGIEAVEYTLKLLKATDANLETLEAALGDPMKAISGCLRGLLCGEPGKELMCSDYSAIEAVVLACLAGEEWRVDVFKTHGKIYEMSASKITGIPFEEMMAHAGYTDLTKNEWWTDKQTGDHHPTRKKIGKVSELASGYQGGLGAWKAFGADKVMEVQLRECWELDELEKIGMIKVIRRDGEVFANLTSKGIGENKLKNKPLAEALNWIKDAVDDKIRASIKAWRKASPNIQKFWYGLEDHAKKAVQNPGVVFDFRGLQFGVFCDTLFIRLLSGRFLNYHQPRLVEDNKFGKRSLKLTFMGIDGYTKKWCRIDTYGGKLCENVVQATSRDLLTFALYNLERAGYPVVMHVHDEIISEVELGHGTVEEFERIMATLPDWAAGWPVRAAGGWRGGRYRKD